MEPQVNKQIIRKYLQGGCSPTELQYMTQFLQREDAAALMEQILAEEWTNFREEQISDQQIGWWRNRFHKHRLKDDSTLVRKLGKRFFSLRYASVWLTALLGLGIWFGLEKIKTKHEKAVEVTMLERVNTNGQRVQIRLSDSSLVYLAGGSRLRYPSRFVGKTREVILNGEAFFEIAKNPKKPFIIQSGKIKTRVVGTSFRIDAFKDKPFLIEVATGKVSISHQQGDLETRLALLTPGQTLSWKDHRATLGETDAEDVSEWKNGRLVFDGASLREVAEVLERWYNVDINFKSQRKAGQRITITLSATVPITDILQVLAKVARLQYKVEGKQIRIN